MQQNRRKFLSKAAQALAATGASAALLPAGAVAPANSMFIHHVYFWLHNADSKEDKSKLLEGLKALSKVKTIKTFHIGQPADTARDVIDRSYALSWLLMFENVAAQESYQVDPIHLLFIKNYSHLWERVVVYDSVDI